MNVDEHATAKPYLKYPGGKAKLAEAIRAQFSGRARLYVEPFLGAAAVLFARQESREFDLALAADINPRLIACHRAVQGRVDDVLGALGQLPWDDTYAHEGGAFYYRARELFNTPGALSGPESAALLVWLSKHCFNGLYRENSSGGMNAPVGTFASAPQPPQPSHLRAVSAAFARTELVCGDFRPLLGAVRRHLEHGGDGVQVYCDPPYVPVSETASFTAYSKGGFDLEDQEELALLLSGLADRGAEVVASNADVPFVRELYGRLGFRFVEVQARRNINRDAEKRGPVGELLLCKRGTVCSRPTSTPLSVSSCHGEPPLASSTSCMGPKP